MFAAGGLHRRTTLAWDEGGGASFQPPVPEQELQVELRKLARVVKRTGQARLTRWRG